MVDQDKGSDTEVQVSPRDGEYTTKLQNFKPLMFNKKKDQPMQRASFTQTISFDILKKQLETKSQKQLSSLIQTVAFRQKKQMFNQVNSKICEYKNSLSEIRQLQPSISELQQTINQLKQQSDQNQNTIDQLSSTIRQNKLEILVHQQIKDEYLKESFQNKQELDQIMQMMNAKQIQVWCKIMSKKSPIDLVRGFETLTGLIKNRKVVTNVDVERCFYNFNKFIDRISKLDATKLDLEIVIHHRNELSSMAPNFIDPQSSNFKQNSPFAVYIAWGQNFSEYAIKILQAQVSSQEIEKLQAEQDLSLQQKRDLVTIGHIYESENITEIFDDQLQFYKAKQNKLLNSLGQQKSEAFRLKLEFGMFEKVFFSAATAVTETNQNQEDISVAGSPTKPQTNFSIAQAVTSKAK